MLERGSSRGAPLQNCRKDKLTLQKVGWDSAWDYVSNRLVLTLKISGAFFVNSKNIAYHGQDSSDISVTIIVTSNSVKCNSLEKFTPKIT